MVITNAQVPAFFEHDNRLERASRSRIKLQDEHVDTPVDLSEVRPESRMNRIRLHPCILIVAFFYVLDFVEYIEYFRSSMPSPTVYGKDMHDLVDSWKSNGTHDESIHKQQQHIGHGRNGSLGTKSSPAVHDNKVMIKCMSENGNTYLRHLADYWKSNSTHGRCMHKIIRKHVSIMHIGKAGGGSLETFNNEYRLGMNMCHPNPIRCRKETDQILSKKQGQKDNGKRNNIPPILPKVIVPIRDPVDRLVSAFNWRSLLLCHSPDIDKRIRGKSHHYTYSYPHKYCNDFKGERARMEGIYDYNVSKFTEALCPEHRNHKQAATHRAHIVHMSHNLVDWFNVLFEESATKAFANFTLQPGDRPQQASSSVGNKNHDIKKIMAVVMDPNGTNESYESSIKALYQDLIVTEMGRSRQEVGWLFQVHDSTTGKTKVGNKKHSSSSSNINWLKPSPISPLGECCATRHLAKDYGLIQVMMGGINNPTARSLYSYSSHHHQILSAVCNWGTNKDTQQCLNALGNIMRRRERYLRDFSVPCSQLVSRKE